MEDRRIYALALAAQIASHGISIEDPVLGFLEIMGTEGEDAAVRYLLDHAEGAVSSAIGDVTIAGLPGYERAAS